MRKEDYQALVVRLHAASAGQDVDHAALHLLAAHALEAAGRELEAMQASDKVEQTRHGLPEFG